MEELRLNPGLTGSPGHFRGVLAVCAVTEAGQVIARPPSPAPPLWPAAAAAVVAVAAAQPFPSAHWQPQQQLQALPPR